MIFKVGVSDWEIEFENNEIIKLTTLASETVKTYSGGAVQIELEDVQFMPRLYELLHSRVDIIKVSRTLKIAETSNDGKIAYESGNIVFGYENIELVSILNYGNHEKTDTFTICMRGDVV